MAQDDDPVDAKKLEDLAKELDRRRGREWMEKLIAAKPELERLTEDLAPDAEAAIVLNKAADKDPTFAEAARRENENFRQKHSVRHRQLLDELVSSAPATQEFLLSRGLTSISQLDKQGRKDLVKFLEDTLSLVLEGKK